MRESWLRSMQSVQTNLARTQTQITTGRTYTRPSENPVAATRELALESSLQQTQQFDRNLESLKSRLGMEESVLERVGGVLQRLRELAVQANNGTQTTETRAAAATEAREHLNALLQLANSQDGKGEYLFGGLQSRTRPFTESAGGVVYNGDQGVRELQISPDRRMADGDNGYEVFMDIRNGNGSFSVTSGNTNSGTGVIGASSVTNPALFNGETYTVTFTAPDAYAVTDSNGDPVTTGSFAPGQSISFAGIEFALDGAPAATDTFVVAPSARQDVFASVQNFIDALGSGGNPASDARMHSDIGNALQEFDQIIGNILEVRTSVGSRLNSIDTQEQVNADSSLNIESLLSELRDLDYAEALTRLQQQMTTMQAAQASYAQTQGLSLFDYL